MIAPDHPARGFVFDRIDAAKALQERRPDAAELQLRCADLIRLGRELLDVMDGDDAARMCLLTAALVRSDHELDQAAALLE